MGHNESIGESSAEGEMKQLTVRGFDKELERRIKEKARAGGISLNRAVLELLNEGAGLAAEAADAGRVGNALDVFIGSWSERQAKELERALEPLEKIEESFWR
jgi:hypothetical protein